jgi:Repeat of unknown function (DUF5907)
MPILGNALDFSKYEARNIRAHQLGAAPATPVTGQLYYNTADNTLYWWDGTAWVSARGGVTAPPDATTTTKGVVQLAGDLAGTAASPQIAAGVITDTDVNAANKDGTAVTPSLRTIGLGAQQAMAGNTRLDTIAAPTGSVSLNGQKATNVAVPTAATDGANKQYVDGLVQGISWKQTVRVVSTGNIAAGGAIGGPQTIDGVVLANGDRVLVIGQSNGQNNGIFTCNTGGTWGRAFDADTGPELVDAAVFVSEGAANADTAWVCTTNAPIVPDTTPLVWTQFSGAAQIVAGAGLTKTGNTVDIGAGAGIQVNADNIQIPPGGVTDAMLATAKSGYFSSAAHGAGAVLTVPAATHGLRASRGLFVQVQNEADGSVELPDISVAANGDVTITYGAAVAANSKRITVVG